MLWPRRALRWLALALALAACVAVVASGTPVVVGVTLLWIYLSSAVPWTLS